MGDVNNAAPDSLKESGTSLGPHICEICYEAYNEQSRIPKVLGCGHTYCLRCVKAMYTHQKSILHCPVCRTTTRSIIDKVPTNFQLLLVIKNQKLLCTEKEEEAEPEHTLQAFIDEEIDEEIFKTVKFFEDEVAKLKKQIQDMGLNPSRCFPNSTYISGTMPGDEDSTLAAISEGVHKLHTTYNGVSYLLRKARIQKQMIAEQMEAGTAKKLPNGGVELNPMRPNGEAVSDADLLNPPVGNILDTIYDYDDDDNPWDDIDSYSGQSDLPFDAEDRLVDNLQRMGFDQYDYQAHPWDEEEPTGSVGYLHHVLSASARLQPDQLFSIPEVNGMCEVCNCPVPPGRHQTEQHEAGRRHRNNLDRRNNGLPPETPPQRPSRSSRGRRGRGAFTSRTVHIPSRQRQPPYVPNHYEWGMYAPRNMSPPPDDNLFGSGHYPW